MDLSQIRIGEGDNFTVRNVARAMLRDSSTSSVLLERWNQFANNLGISQIRILSIRQGLSSGRYQFDDVFQEILSIWKAEKGTEATLKVLCDALVETGSTDIAEHLQNKFGSEGPN